MTTTERAVGEYVQRTLVTTEVGTFTGVPATTSGTYVTGIDDDRPAGRYTQHAVGLRAPTLVNGAVPTGTVRTHHRTLVGH